MEEYEELPVEIANNCVMAYLKKRFNIEGINLDKKGGGEYMLVV